MEAGVGPTILKFEARKEPDDANVSVLDHGAVESSKVGDVTGVEGAAGLAGKARVEVAKGARIKGSEIGDISGVRVGGNKAGEP